jgi:hypothetical protein
MPESHSVDHSSRCLKLQQQAAVQAAVRMHPMASSTDVCRNLHIVDKKRLDEVYISPAKKRTVQREVAKERRKVLLEFTNGEQIDRTEVWKHAQHQVRSRQHHDQLVAFARQSDMSRHRK